MYEHYSTGYSGLIHHFCDSKTIIFVVFFIFFLIIIFALQLDVYKTLQKQYCIPPKYLLYSMSLLHVLHTCVVI